MKIRWSLAAAKQLMDLPHPHRTFGQTLRLWQRLVSP